MMLCDVAMPGNPEDMPVLRRETSAAARGCIRSAYETAAALVIHNHGNLNNLIYKRELEKRHPKASFHVNLHNTHKNASDNWAILPFTVLLFYKLL